MSGHCSRGHKNDLDQSVSMDGGHPRQFPSVKRRAFGPIRAFAFEMVDRFQVLTEMR